MAFITQFYTWATGNTITATRLNGNVTNVTNGLSGGTVDINVGTMQIGGTEIVNGSRAATFTAITTSGDITSTGQAIDWDLVDNNASALSFDAAGKAGILEIITTDSSEGIKTSGTFEATGAATLSSTLAVTGATTLTGQLNANDDIVLATGKALQTSTSDTNTALIQAYDVDGAAYTTFITLTAGNTPTCVFSGDITTTTQSANDNSTKIATTAYVDTAIGTINTWGEVMANGDTYYVASNDGNPEMRMGATDAEELHIQTVYDSGAQTLDYVLFQTDAASATADKGEYRFNVDGTLVATFDDGGLEIRASGSLSFGAVDILTDSAGTTTLSNIDAIDATTETTLESAIDSLSNLVTVGALDSGSITSGFGAIDNGTSNITTGGILKVDVDGTALNAAGSITMGAGNDAGMFFDGTDLIIRTDGAGASGIILDSEDDTVVIQGSGSVQATFDTSGLNLVSGDAYYIDSTSVLNATTLGSGVTGSSLTSVGTLTALTISGLITATATSGEVLRAIGI